jgi:hypothetical protein
MFIKNGVRWNKPYSRGTTEIDGVRYPNTVWDDPAFRTAQGISTIPDPVFTGDDETFYTRTDTDTAPYTTWERKPDAVIADIKNERLLQRIDSMERNVMLPRVTREFMLASFIASLPEGTDPMTNIGYKRMKELDDEIKALRQQIVTTPVAHINEP